MPLLDDVATALSATCAPEQDDYWNAWAARLLSELSSQGVVMFASREDLERRLAEALNNAPVALQGAEWPDTGMYGHVDHYGWSPSLIPALAAALAARLLPGGGGS